MWRQKNNENVENPRMEWIYIYNDMMEKDKREDCQSH